MTLFLDLSSELEERLAIEAERTGLTTENVAIQLLDRHLPATERRKKAMALLKAWAEEEEDAEQIETGTYLQRSLDEDRLSNRELFPESLHGVTW